MTTHGALCHRAKGPCRQQPRGTDNRALLLEVDPVSCVSRGSPWLSCQSCRVVSGESGTPSGPRRTLPRLRGPVPRRRQMRWRWTRPRRTPWASRRAGQILSILRSHSTSVGSVMWDSVAYRASGPAAGQCAGGVVAVPVAIAMRVAGVWVACLRRGQPRTVAGAFPGSSTVSWGSRS
jgi:hypothetical protein